MHILAIVCERFIQYFGVFDTVLFGSCPRFSILNDSITLRKLAHMALTRQLNDTIQTVVSTAARVYSGTIVTPQAIPECANDLILFTIPTLNYDGAQQCQDTKPSHGTSLLHGKRVVPTIYCFIRAPRVSSSLTYNLILPLS